MMSDCILDGVDSLATESKIVAYKWRVASVRVRRPSQYNAPDLSIPLAQDGSRLKVEGLLPGDYTFELMVENTFGFTHKSKVQLFVRQHVDVGDDTEHVLALGNNPVILS